MSNLDYTLGIISNVISQVFSGATDEVTFVNSQNSILTEATVDAYGPSIAVY